MEILTINYFSASGQFPLKMSVTNHTQTVSCNTMNNQQLNELFEIIENYDTDTATLEEIKHLINPVLNSIFMNTPLIDNSEYLFRSVNLGNLKPSKFDQIIYPPKDMLKNYQRLNEPFCPVFYCSTSKHSAVFEGRYKVGDLIAISEWEVIEDKNLATTNIGYTKFMENWTDRKNPKWHENTERFKGKSKEDIERNYLVLDFLSKIFCKNFDDKNSKYKISIAISNLLGFHTESENTFIKIGHEQFKGENAFEAVVFPSILMKAKADNLAIRRDIFHKKINFVCVEFLKITKVDENDFAFEVIDFANEIENGDILWKGRPGNFTLTQGVLTKLEKTFENGFALTREDGKKLYKS